MGFTYMLDFITLSKIYFGLELISDSLIGTYLCYEYLFTMFKKPGGSYAPYKRLLISHTYTPIFGRLDQFFLKKKKKI